MSSHSYFASLSCRHTLYSMVRLCSTPYCGNLCESISVTSAAQHVLMALLVPSNLLSSVSCYPLLHAKLCELPLVTVLSSVSCHLVLPSSVSCPTVLQVGAPCHYPSRDPGIPTTRSHFIAAASTTCLLMGKCRSLAVRFSARKQ
jgi:hypothetical protein